MTKQQCHILVSKPTIGKMSRYYRMRNYSRERSRYAYLIRIENRIENNSWKQWNIPTVYMLISLTIQECSPLHITNGIKSFDTACLYLPLELIIIQFIKRIYAIYRSHPTSWLILHYQLKNNCRGLCRGSLLRHFGSIKGYVARSSCVGDKNLHNILKLIDFPANFQCQIINQYQLFVIDNII